MTMKSLIFAFLLFAASVLGADSTNGVFYANNSVECHLILQNGSITTNLLAAEKTYMVSDALVEMAVTNKTIFYFAGGLMVESSPGSLFSINLFDQQVKNLNVTPRQAEFGNHNISLTFIKGEFIVLYYNTNVYSSFSVMTPQTGREYAIGKYVFVVDDKTTVNIIEGDAPAVNPKKSDGKVVNKSRTKTTTEVLSPDQIAKYMPSIEDLTKKKDDVRFFVVGNQVIGIWMK